MKATEQTKAAAAALGIKHGPNISEEKLLERLEMPAPAMVHPSQRPVDPVHNHTDDDILKAISKFTDKPGFKAEFDDETWTFSYRGREESGNKKIPMRIIVMKAENVSKGALMPAFGVDAGGQKFMWGNR